MQKIFKRLAVVLMAVIASACLLLIVSACTDGKVPEGGDGVPEGKVLVTVLKPDGTPVNGLTDGNGYDGELNSETVVKIQFCLYGSEDLAEQLTCNTPTTLGEDGKLMLDIQNNIEYMANSFAEYETLYVQIHILYIDGYLSNGDYGTFEVGKIPSKIDVTLKAE